MQATTHNETAKITELRGTTSDGALPAYAWPGGYQLFYLDEGNNILCPACANDNDAYCEQLTDYDANYENTELYCDHCSAPIAASYAD